MAHIVKLKFHVLDVNGQSYQFWRLDVEFHLQGEGLANALVEDGEATTKDKNNALIFMCRHLHEKLKGPIAYGSRSFGTVDQAQGPI